MHIGKIVSEIIPVPKSMSELMRVQVRFEGWHRLGGQMGLCDSDMELKSQERVKKEYI